MTFKKEDFRIGDRVRLHPMEGRILAIHEDVIYISLSSPGYDPVPWCVKFAGVSEIIEAAPGRKNSEVP
jgi:hypothetical protein